MPQPGRVGTSPLQRIELTTCAFNSLHRLGDGLLGTLRQRLSSQQSRVDLREPILQLLQVEDRFLLTILQLFKRQIVELSDRALECSLLFLQQFPLQAQQLGGRFIQPLLQRFELLGHAFKLIKGSKSGFQRIDVTLFDIAQSGPLLGAQLGKTRLDRFTFG